MGDHGKHFIFVDISDFKSEILIVLGDVVKDEDNGVFAVPSEREDDGLKDFFGVGEFTVVFSMETEFLLIITNEIL